MDVLGFTVARHFPPTGPLATPPPPPPPVLTAGATSRACLRYECFDEGGHRGGLGLANGPCQNQMTSLFGALYTQGDPRRIRQTIGRYTTIPPGRQDDIVIESVFPSLAVLESAAEIPSSTGFSLLGLDSVEAGPFDMKIARGSRSSLSSRK